MIGIFDDMFTAISTLMIVILVLILAYFMTKKIGKGMIQYQSSRNMKVLDRIMLGQDKSLLIIQIGQRYCLIGVAQSGIQLLMQLDGSEITTFDDSKNLQTENVLSQFSEVLSEKFGKKRH